LHVHQVAKYYDVPVVLHTDHAAKKWLPWISALIDESEKYHKLHGQPLFSSHMLDLSEEPIEENIQTSVEFFKRMAPLGMGIEIELGVTGGEEDGVDNSGIENDKLYTQPEHVAYAYTELGKVGNLFTVAAAFGNVHGVYSPGNVELKPEILHNSQLHIEKTLGTAPKPVYFVFHGGSGSPQNQIREAIGYGAIKMNLDTDLQWAFWEGILGYYKKNEAYLQTQLLVAPDQNFTATGFGTAVQISDNERWMYISAPGANQIYAYARVDVPGQSVSYTTNGTTATFVYNNDIMIDPTYPGQLLVTLNNSLQVYGTDYVINGVLVQFLNTPGTNNTVLIRRRTSVQLDFATYAGVTQNSTTGSGSGATFTVVNTREITQLH
jgi:ketose-bisphosphate aldolase